MATTDAVQFWSWFEREVLPILLLDQVPDHSLLEQLDQKLAAMAVSWELGPARDGSDAWALAISFGGDLEVLPRARAVTSCAPTMERCQVFLGKPPKRWDGVLELPSGGDRVRVHTAGWLCFLLPMDGGMAIMVSPEGAENVDEDTLAVAAEIAVQSELGELRFARDVRDLSLVAPERASSLPGVRCKMRDLGSAASSR